MGLIWALEARIVASRGGRLELVTNDTGSPGPCLRWLEPTSSFEWRWKIDHVCQPCLVLEDHGFASTIARCCGGGNAMLHGRYFPNP
jgi:hypothetical protein